MKVPELMAEASFIQKRRETELQAEVLKVGQELAKTQAREREREKGVDKGRAAQKRYHQIIQKSTIVSKTTTLFKNLFITKKSLSAEIYPCK